MWGVENSRMILNNFHWEFKQKFCIDQKQIIRATLYEIVKLFFQKFKFFPGLQLPVSTICTKFCIGGNSFQKKRRKKCCSICVKRFNNWTIMIELSNIIELFSVTTLLNSAAFYFFMHLRQLSAMVKPGI